MTQQKLPRINYGKLSHDQLRTLVLRIITAWNSREKSTPTIKLLLAKLTAQLELLDKILLKEKASALTKTVNEKDALRDRAYRHLLNKIKLALDSFDETVADAAEELLPVVEQFGVEIVDLAQSEESARLDLALQEFNKPENLTVLTTLDMIPDLERVALFNDEFEAVLEERTKAENNKEDLPRLKAVRREIIYSMGLFTKVAEFLFNEGNATIDSELYGLLTSEITDAAALSKMRESLADNSAE